MTATSNTTTPTDALAIDSVASTGPAPVQKPAEPEAPIHKSIPWIMISGDQGVGKTTLAASGKDGYCLDTDGRSFIFDHKKQFEYGPKMFQEMHGFVKLLLAKGVRTKEGIEVGGKLIRYLVIDTYDTVQRVLVTRYLEQKKSSGSDEKITAPTMEMRDWGILLNYQSPLLMDMKNLRIPVVICAHTKETEPIYDNFQNLKRPGKIDFAIAGAISGHIMNLVTYGLFVYEGEAGRMIRASKGLVYQSQVTTTKDGGRLFTKKPEHAFAIDPVSGKSKSQWIDMILARHEYDPSEKPA